MDSRRVRRGSHSAKLESRDCVTVRRCRICGDGDLVPILDLGKTPLANSFLSTRNETERLYPLRLLLCASCSLVQLGEVVTPDLMFQEYPYRTSSSVTVPAHFQELARYLATLLRGSGRSRVYEVASNDGTLLRALTDGGLQPVGVDPAANLCRIAKSRGLSTVHGYFTDELATELVRDFGLGQAVVANNVLAHVNDLGDFMTAVGRVLAEGGYFLAEVPYLGDLIQNVEYDTIYHEHLSYFSIKPVLRLLKEHGFRLVDLHRFEVHGGSIRFIAQKAPGEPKRLPFVAMEKEWGLYSEANYRSFDCRVRFQIALLRELLGSLKREGNRIIGYGAPAKGNTLLNVCGITPDLLDYITDTTPEKQGKFAPGSRIPVVSPSVLEKDRPPYALMLAWNYLPEILHRESRFQGQYIVPIPSPRVLPRPGPV
jgi:SAM-dependent methyltransferase